MPISSTETYAQAVIHLVALAIDLMVVVIIGYAAMRTLWLMLRARLTHRVKADVVDMRFDLGMSIILGLEFLIGADILRTSIAPTWSVIGQLAAVILLRSFLTYTLEWELSRLRHINQKPDI